MYIDNVPTSIYQTCKYDLADCDIFCNSRCIKQSDFSDFLSFIFIFLVVVCLKNGIIYMYNL